MTVGEYIEQNYNPRMNFEGKRKFKKYLDAEVEVVKAIVSDDNRTIRVIFSKADTGEVIGIYQEVQRSRSLERKMFIGRDGLTML